MAVFPIFYKHGALISIATAKLCFTGVFRFNDPVWTKVCVDWFSPGNQSWKKRNFHQTNHCKQQCSLAGPFAWQNSMPPRCQKRPLESPLWRAVRNWARRENRRKKSVPFAPALGNRIRVQTLVSTAHQNARNVERVDAAESHLINKRLVAKLSKSTSEKCWQKKKKKHHCEHDVFSKTAHTTNCPTNRWWHC